MTLESDPIPDSSGSRPQFGARFLSSESDVFQHNAWDNVEWGEEQEREAQEAVDKAASSRVEADMAEIYEEKAAEYWDKFYSIHQNRFFKERNWLFTEFPDLAPGYQGAVRVYKEGDKEDRSEEIKTNASKPCDAISQLDIDRLRENESYLGEKSNIRLLEVGCGTGSTVFPILEMNTRPDLMVYCCDLSNTAVSLVRDHPEYSRGRCHAWVCDVTSDEEWEAAPFTPDSLDIITLIFVLSAVSPAKMEAVARNMFKFLKPGGLLMFRDYGRYDLAQLRFKKGKCIEDNFYVRGDGTRCYFFTQEEIKNLFESAGLKEVQNLVDRRLQVNRGKKLKMYRVWIQGKFMKPSL